MGETQNKRLLRESMRGILPEPIRTRWSKQGFRPPQDLWFKSPAFLKRVEEDLSIATRRPNSPWLPRWWSRALDRVKAGETSLAWVVWQPFILEQWRQHFLEPIIKMRAVQPARHA